MIGFLVPQMYLQVSSRDVHLSALFFYALCSLAPIGSSFWFFYQTASLLLSGIIVAYTDGPSYLSMTIGSAQAMLFGSEAYWSVLEIFVPLTGRIGIESPAENIIAIIATWITFMSWPLLPAYLATLSRQIKVQALYLMIAATAIGVFILSLRDVWDSAHPRRLFVQYLYNVTDSSTSLHLASADPAPKFMGYLEDIATRLDLGIVQENQMTEWLSDWDTIYPFSQFLNSYRIDLPTPTFQTLPDSYFDPEVTGSALTTQTHENGTREVAVTIDCHHPGLIWTVISFDAHIKSWDLPMPDSGYQRHHIKQVSTHGSSPRHSLSMQLYLPHDHEPSLWVDFVGIEELGMYPAMSKDEDAMARDSMQLFKKLEGPGGVGDAVDMCSNGVVAGRFRIDLGAT